MSNKRLKVSHGGSGIGLGSSLSEVPSASISDLPNDLLKHCFSFIPGSYVNVAPVSRQFFSNYSTVGIDDSLTALSTDVLLKIGRNRRTTVDAVSNDAQLTEYCFIIAAPDDFMIKVCHKAALKGRTDVIDCAKAFRINLDNVMWKKDSMDVNLIENLAKEGNIEMIQYFDSSKFYLQIWKEIFYKAMASDHIHVMKWVFQESSQYDDWGTFMKTMIEAYEHVLEGVEATEVTFRLCGMAAERGNIQVLEYCHQNNLQFNVLSELCDFSMENKDEEKALESLKWLRRHGCPWDEDLCELAARNNYFNVLKWARSEGCPWNENTMKAAAESGNTVIIKYCIENECPMTEEACESAMLNKDRSKALEVLKLLRNLACPWDSWTILNAIDNHNFEAMMWAKRNGCPWNKKTFTSLVQEGNISIIEEFLRDEPQHNVNDVFEAALANKTSSDAFMMEKFKLLHKYGYKWNARTMSEAAKQGRLRVMQWLRKMGCPMNAFDTCIAAVEESKNKAVMKYAHEVAGCKLSEGEYKHCFGRYIFGSGTPIFYV
ncbi:hypothetical protein CTEN210_04067 [Chaetoceros tenuissimus]|uniref:Uncharacterized protein n=1 Tax=Chaetoceros tenuissimus TaxID=426638 RepID=A0AAD3CK65_9STRA|nr:hypothetical protein CTEN210_04067 [Chaetoceros tenuissimus]